MNADLTTAGGDGPNGGMRPWKQARTLADLGELTAQWLEGRISSQPAYEPDAGPDGETLPLVPVLAALNRAGFVTSGSQPAFDGKGSGGAHWRQRAAVKGYAPAEVLDRLRSCVRLDPAHGTFPLLIAQKASLWRYRYDRAVAVTRTDGCDPDCPTRHADGCDYTWFGARVPRHRHIRDPHMGYGICHPDAVDALCEAWQVTVIDPEWGRNDLLWPALTRAVADCEVPA